MSVHLPVADAYDRWAASYDGYDNPMVFVAGEVLGRELAALAGLDVFEFGCGTGRNLRRGGRALVIEIHPYLAAFREAGLRVAGCREWRPVDLGTPAPLKALKRGPHFPMTVSFTLVADAGD